MNININKEEIIRLKSTRISDFQKKIRVNKFLKVSLIFTTIAMILFLIGFVLYTQKQMSIQCYISYANGNIENCSLSQTQIENINRVFRN